jgi:hypothetical protein
LRIAAQRLIVCPPTTADGVHFHRVRPLRGHSKGVEQMLGTLLIVLLVLLLIGSLPSWPYSRGWGYYPSSGIGLIVLLLVLLLLLGYL